MSRAEAVQRRTALWAALLASLLLSACSSAPRVSEPLLRKQAQEAEADGARRYARGDYAGAMKSFAAASKLQQSFDDSAAAARSQLNQAHAELALGRAEAALTRVLRIADPDLGLDALLLQAQANLALGRLPATKVNLTDAAAACPASCPQRASLHLLQARAALVANRAADAAAHADAALKLLQDKDEANETGNAWRLVATARLAGGDTTGALPAVQRALEIDRKLALPEKIARDWLLIGDIRKKAGSSEAVSAYQRALDVANAANLADIGRIATQAIAELSATKGISR